MRINRLHQGIVVLSLPSIVALALLGCSGGHRGEGCTKDSDCKGQRICASGECVEQPTKAPEPGVGVQQPQQPQQPLNPQQPMNPQQPAAPGPAAYGNDGLPVEIPPPGSQVPTVQEWAAVPREVTCRGSSALNCETKMLREWLRVSCHPSAAKGTPFMIDMGPTNGQQAFKFVGTGVASVVVQVVRGREFTANYIWDNGGAHQGAELHVSWPSDHTRPVLYFQTDE